MSIGAVWVYDQFLKREILIQDVQHQSRRINVSIPEDYDTRLSQLLSVTHPTAFVNAAKSTTASVVYILAYERLKGNSIYSKDYKRERGSGVIASPDGFIVTNYHVVKSADYISITLEDKREYEAEIVGFDELSDIALLKIQSDNLPYLLFANSDSLQVGEWILAVGNPFGLQSTVTAGIVSAKGRNIEAINKNDVESLIQTDAVINPGSSGGALVNQNGLLVGICTAILSSSGNYEGLSFALPSNLVQKIIIDLREFGAVQRGKLGITVQDINASIAEKYKLDKITGVQIKTVNLNSSAAKVGLLKDDILMELNGAKLNSAADFYEQINKYRPGDKIRIVYNRQSVPREVFITLTNYLNTTDYISIRSDKTLRDLGIEIRDLHEAEILRTKSKGVMVISVSRESIIDRTNMEPGFIIESINGLRVESATELMAILKNTSGEIVFEGFYERYAGQFPYTFQMPEKN